MRVHVFARHYYRHLAVMRTALGDRVESSTLHLCLLHMKNLATHVHGNGFKVLTSMLT